MDGCHEMTGLIVKPVWFITWIICKDDHYQGKVNQTVIMLHVYVQMYVGNIRVHSNVCISRKYINKKNICQNS